MWNPEQNLNLPAEFEVVLENQVWSSDEDIDSDVDIIVEDVELDVIEAHLVREDGSLEPAAAASCGTDEEDEELEPAYNEVNRPGSPVSPSSPPVPDAAGDAPVPSDSGAGGSGSGGAGGLGGGSRGWRVPAHGRRARRGGMSGRSGVKVAREWLRSDPLVERFESDDVIPAQVREEIERLDATRRSRRERVLRGRRVANRRANVEEISDGENDEEEEALGSEEFIWKSMADWHGEKESFLPENPGPTRSFDNAYDAFRSYWDDALLTNIVDETNRYARGVRSARFQRNWFNTNIDEILILFAFWMMMGIIRMPTIKSCFSTLTILRTEIFRFMFTENRYWDLNRAFRLENGARDANDPDNVLYPMGPVIDQLNIKFQQNYRLHQEICIDQSLTLWKGPVAFKQYIKTKAARFGIKTYQLCEPSTGYLWSFFVYAGRRTNTSTLPSSISYVVRLVQPLLNLGHVLYMDNWFSSPTLARYLKRRRTDCVGTLRSSRKHVPAVLQRAPLAEGEFVARQSGDVMIVTLQDRKRVTCISTFHGVDQVQKVAIPGRPAHYKLKLIDDYNQWMGGVDRLDQTLEAYLVERKQCRQWTMKLFKHLLKITIQNARVLVEKSTNTSVSSVLFRCALVRSILDRHKPNVPSRNPQNPPPAPRMVPYQFPAERLTGRHFIRRILITDDNLGRRQCVWCTVNGRPNSRTAYECPQCNVALCLDFCFEQFHTTPCP